LTAYAAGWKKYFRKPGISFGPDSMKNP